MIVMANSLKILMLEWNRRPGWSKAKQGQTFLYVPRLAAERNPV